MLVSSATTLLLHVGLSYALIYQLGLGYRGAAIATNLSFWLNAVLLVLYVKCSGVCKETWNGFSREAFVGLDSLAVPSCIMTCIEYWCFELLVLLAGLLPNPQLELSALSICLSTISLNYMIPFGLSAAASTRVSNELGAHDGQAAKRAVYVVMSVSIIQAVIVSSILLSHFLITGACYLAARQRLLPTLQSLCPTALALIYSMAFKEFFQNRELLGLIGPNCVQHIFVSRITTH